MAHPLDGAFARVRRAEKHLRELVCGVEAFQRQHKEFMVAEYDKGTDQIRVSFKRPPVVPVELSLIASDIIHNLRSALDYIIYELARHDSGVIQEGTQFLIEDAAESFAKRSKGYLKGLNPKHVAAVQSLQPYKGVQWTKILRDISNPDKHRELIGIDRDWLTDSIIMRDDHGTLLKDPDVILRTVGDAGFNVSVKFHQAISVKFPNGLPVAQTLDGLKSQIADTVEAFKPEF